MNAQTDSDGVINNVFSLDKPDSYKCAVFDYDAELSILFIKIYHSTNNEEYLISFPSIQYFSGPLRWVGANFQTRPWQECVQLILELNEKQPSDVLLEAQHELGTTHFQLYVVNAIKPEREIRILAGRPNKVLKN